MATLDTVLKKYMAKSSQGYSKEWDREIWTFEFRVPEDDWSDSLIPSNGAAAPIDIRAEGVVLRSEVDYTGLAGHVVARITYGWSGLARLSDGQAIGTFKTYVRFEQLTEYYDGSNWIPISKPFSEGDEMYIWIVDEIPGKVPAPYGRLQVYSLFKESSLGSAIGAGLSPIGYLGKTGNINKTSTPSIAGVNIGSPNDWLFVGGDMSMRRGSYDLYTIVWEFWGKFYDNGWANLKGQTAQKKKIVGQVTPNFDANGDQVGEGTKIGFKDVAGETKTINRVSDTDFGPVFGIIQN